MDLNYYKRWGFRFKGAINISYCHTRRVFSEAQQWTVLDFRYNRAAIISFFYMRNALFICVSLHLQPCGICVRLSCSTYSQRLLLELLWLVLYLICTWMYVQMNKYNVDLTTLYAKCCGKWIIDCVFLFRRVQVEFTVCRCAHWIYSTAGCVNALETANIHIVPDSFSKVLTVAIETPK